MKRLNLDASLYTSLQCALCVFDSGAREALPYQMSITALCDLDLSEVAWSRRVADLKKFQGAVRLLWPLAFGTAATANWRLRGARDHVLIQFDTSRNSNRRLSVNAQEGASHEP
jgi:hypothetical protein